MSLRHISQFIKTNSHTNVIIATALHCYDSVASSMVNDEVLKFNRKYFTNHGLHLNNMGKETIYKQIKEIVEETFIVNDMSSIRMEWIMEQAEIKDAASKARVDDIANDISSTVIRTSNRKRKLPSNRNEDFLWVV
jgi:hypothetical protein